MVEELVAALWLKRWGLGRGGGGGCLMVEGVMLVGRGGG